MTEQSNIGIPHPDPSTPGVFTGSNPAADVGEPGNLGGLIGAPAGYAVAVPAPVQVAGPVQAASLTGPLTATLGTPAGSKGPSTLVACITTVGTVVNPAVSGITLGGAADNWQAAVTDPGLVQFGAAVWYDPACAAGQTSVVLICAGGAGTTPGMYLTVYEVPGILVFDQGSYGDTGVSASTPWSSGATPAVGKPNEIFFAAAMDTAQIPVVTGAGTWTTVSTGAGNFDQAAGYQVVTGGGTATFSGTRAISSKYSAIVATFHL